MQERRAPARVRTLYVRSNSFAIESENVIENVKVRKDQCMLAEDGELLFAMIGENIIEIGGAVSSQEICASISAKLMLL